MKIVCDNCGAKYSIADEKVAGKVFKIRCKKCTHVIVVRGDQSAAADDAATSAGFDYGGEAVWHVVVEGDQQGPFSPQQSPPSAVTTPIRAAEMRRSAPIPSRAVAVGSVATARSRRLPRKRRARAPTPAPTSSPSPIRRAAPSEAPQTTTESSRRRRAPASRRSRPR
jgi:predicted Zn finger-like uncharacterized protein